MAPAFSIRGQNWAQQHLPNYDLAFYMSPRPESTDGRDSNTDKIDEKGVRGSFLKLFVALLKDYRGFVKFIIFLLNIILIILITITILIIVVILFILHKVNHFQCINFVQLIILKVL